jgi:hypothetical protein
MLQILINEEMIEHKNCKCNKNNLMNYLETISKNKGYHNIKEIVVWYNDNDMLICYGWMNGCEDKKNKHEVVNSEICETDLYTQPITLYGDIFIIKYKQNKYMDLSISEYGNFYIMNKNYYNECDENNELNETSNDEKYFHNKVHENKISSNIQDNSLMYDNTDYSII